MARLTKDEWGDLRADYEINGMSYSELSIKYIVGKTTVSDKVRKFGWVKGFTEQLVKRKVKATKELKAITEQTEQLSVRNREEFGKRFNYKLRMEQELDEAGFVAARINKIAARKLEKRIDDDELDIEDEAKIIDKVSTIAGTYQKLYKSNEPKTVINNNQVSNTLNLTLEEEKQELMNILNAYD